MLTGTIFYGDRTNGLNFKAPITLSHEVGAAYTEEIKIFYCKMYTVYYRIVNSKLEVL